MHPHLPTIWTSPGWRLEVEEWIGTALTAAGLERTGPIEQPRVRTWATQLTIPTTAGLLWFKENHPAMRAEAAIVEELGRLAPDHVVVPLAVERSRGWLLSPDHGPTLTTLGGVDETLWARVVAEFAELQRRVAGDGGPLLAAGLIPLLPAMAADHVEAQVQRMRGLPPDDSLFVAPELADRALEALPRLRRIAERLGAIGPPLASLEHNDLHQNNVFIPRPDETTLRFFDFGDSLWAHPFTSMAVPVGVLCRDWETGPEDPRIGRIIDAYLDVWSTSGSLPELREMERLTRLLCPVHRFESWRRLLDGSPVEGHEEDIEAVQYWLGRVADTPLI